MSAAGRLYVGYFALLTLSFWWAFGPVVLRVALVVLVVAVAVVVSAWAAEVLAARRERFDR